MFQALRRRRGVLEVIAFLSAFLPTPTPSLLFFRFPRRPILNWRACSQAIWLALVLGSFFVFVVLCFVLFVLFCFVFLGGKGVNCCTASLHPGVQPDTRELSGSAWKNCRGGGRLPAMDYLAVEGVGELAIFLFWMLLMVSLEFYSFVHQALRSQAVFK